MLLKLSFLGLLSSAILWAIPQSSAQESISVTLSGTIIHADGSPAEGASVWAGTLGNTFHTATRSDSNGHFSLSVPTNDRYYVEFRSAQHFRAFYNPRAVGNHSAKWNEPHGWIKVRSTDITLPTIQLPSTERLILSILTHDDRPLGSGILRLCLMKTSWRTSDCPIRSWLNESTEYSIALPPDELYLEIVLENQVWWYSDLTPHKLSANPADLTVVDGRQPQAPSLTLRVPSPQLSFPVVLDLAPGGNLIGWYGAHLTIADLFEQAPEVIAVILYERNGRPSSLHHRFVETGASDYSELRYGEVAAIYVSGEESTRLTVHTHRPPGRLTLPAGKHFVAWPGPDGSDITKVKQSLGTAALDVAAVTKSADYSKDGGDDTTLSRGDVLYVELSREINWLPNLELEPLVIAVGASSKGVAMRVSAQLERVQAFFWEKSGLVNHSRRTFVSANWKTATGRSFGSREGFAGTGLFLNRSDEILIAHEYAHALQQGLSTPSGVPNWLAEGTAVYWADWGYLQTQPGGEGKMRAFRSRLINSPRVRTIRLENVEYGGPDDPNTTHAYAYTLGALATEWLANNAGGNEAVVEFWRAYRVHQYDQAEGWKAAFEEAFGLTVEDFYERFATYQDAGFN